MYSADHIERVLLTFPGVFAGIGEFSVHKEFVPSKVSGHAASLRNPALDRILDTAAEIGLADPRYDHIALDISWDEVAKYVVRDEASLKAWTALIERHPTRFLFGTDAVAPANWEGYVANYTVYAPLWERLDPAARAQVERLNYERIFDAAIPRVRAWEERQLAGGSGG